MTVTSFTPPAGPESPSPLPATPDTETVQHASVPDVSATARFGIGEVVRHKLFPFRGVIFDVDPEFANSEEWWEAIPESVRPRKDQPYYHLLAENDDSAYVAYVSQQNLIHDELREPVQHPAVAQMFASFEDGRYILRPEVRN